MAIENISYILKNKEKKELEKIPIIFTSLKDIDGHYITKEKGGPLMNLKFHSNLFLMTHNF